MECFKKHYWKITNIVVFKKQNAAVSINLNNTTIAIDVTVCVTSQTLRNPNKL